MMSHVSAGRSKAYIRSYHFLERSNMLQTYRAILKGDQVVWTGRRPQALENERIPVEITVLEAEPGDALSARASIRAAALGALVRAGGITDEDPVEWQRELRRDDEQHYCGDGPLP